MRIIQEYRRVTEEIEAIESELQRLNRRRSRIMWSGYPATPGAIDYSADRVQTSMSNLDPEAELVELAGIMQRIRELEQERSELYLQRERLESAVDWPDERRKLMVMMRIKGYNPKEIAAELGCSSRWVRKVLSNNGVPFSSLSRDKIL